MSERVLVIGGTRGTGCLTIARLLEQGYEVRALARNVIRAREVLDPSVETVWGDITQAGTLTGAVSAVDHIVFTAGVTQRPASEQRIVATVFGGLKNTLAAAQAVGLPGRFVYMTALGVNTPSLTGAFLNLVKRNTLRWRRRAEDEIRACGLAYTIVRAGVLTSGPGGRRTIDVAQSDYPLSWLYRISRADVADTLVRALGHANTARTTFDVVWGRGRRREDWDTMFERLKPDD